MIETFEKLVRQLSEEERAQLRDFLEAEAGAEGEIPKIFPDLDYDPFEEDRQFAFENLDDVLEAVAACVTEERGSQWKLGAVVASAVDAHGRYGTYKQMASVCAYTTRRLKTFEVLHRTFPPALRYPDQPLLLYEVALQCDDPVAAIEEALDNAWSPRELEDALAEQKGEEVSRVKLFSGEALVETDGPRWQINVDADRDWPEGDGSFACYVTVRQILREDHDEP